MKKDKAVRNAELKSAIIKQLKSLIGPFIIFLIKEIHHEVKYSIKIINRNI